LQAYHKASEKGQTPYTPAIPLFFALEEALNMVMEEGMDNRIRRHRTLARGMRAAVDAWGLELFPGLNATSHYSNTVTAVKMPEGIDDKTLRGTLRERGIVIAGGQSHLSGKIFRVATMGTLTPDVLLHVINEIELVLAENKVIDGTGVGVEAASGVMR
jgi:aspartate aminotransferase-like enzyme